MTNDERQRHMDFIVESQARSEARLDRLERIAKLMVKAGLRARRGTREVDARISTLVDSQLQTEEISRRNSEDIRANRIDIKALAATVERNGADIGQLAEIVRQLAVKRNGASEGEK